MKITYLLSLALFINMSCNTPISTKDTTQKPTGFTLTGTVFDKDGESLYLHIFKNNQIQKIDSVKIHNQEFQFTGALDYPHKASLLFKGHNNEFPFILSNENVQVNLDAYQIENSQIKNSKINDELAKIKEASAHIYRKIDYLYPLLQKARIENDSKNLKKINLEIQTIMDENQTYLLNYIKENPDHYLSALLLNDLWFSRKNDTLVLKKLASQLNIKVKPALDFAIH